MVSETDLTTRERQTWWPGNRDSSGHLSFLLPGESTIDSATMQRRTRIYYEQIRGRYKPSQAKGLKALEHVRNMLAE